ncbi:MULTISPECIES: hypothetical protein [Citrobacter freundii complex]|nr:MULTISPECIES: hypothetical protein [Citrobacter freundii complex]HAK7474975.1 hypothetical protein [Salmonella enterica]MDT7093046.1 hypothetical protein [Citrobacter freundii]HAK8236150.1 hypothetical protein [Salmonella enterica]HAK8531559.1 hypothetical protein [Salmonella enterica]HAK8549916.1 hypothetical protein [Salmonella enterica]
MASRQNTQVGQKTLPPSSAGDFSSWLFMNAVAPEEEKGTASEPAIPS